MSILRDVGGGQAGEPDCLPSDGRRHSVSQQPSFRYLDCKSFCVKNHSDTRKKHAFPSLFLKKSGRLRRRIFLGSLPNFPEFIHFLFQRRSGRQKIYNTNFPVEATAPGMQRLLVKSYARLTSLQRPNRSVSAYTELKGCLTTY